MTMSRNTHTSPIKKISHAGSKLATAAAHRGSQIIDQASSAVHSAVLSAASRSPPSNSRQNQTSHCHPTMDRRSPPKNGGIRDKIHKFDSVAASSRGGLGSLPSKSTKPCQGHSFPQRYSDMRREQNEHDLSRSSNRCLTAEQSRMQVEKENYVPNQQQREFSHIEHGSVIPDTPRKCLQENIPHPLCEKPHHDKTDILMEHWNKLEHEKKMLETKNKLLKEHCEILTTENEKLRASSITNLNNNGSHIIGEKITHNRHATKKRCNNEHPLISSPLRKHIKAVHESSESNSVITIRKGPYPLFLMENLPCDQSASESHMIERTSHLQTLGILAGTTKNYDSSNISSLKSNTLTVEDDSEQRMDEEALDLMNSAAFMFNAPRKTDS